MEASILDLRYHMNDVLKALERNEEVRILYHGKLKGVIQPVVKIPQKKIKDHPFFGMFADKKISVDKVMQSLRGGRYENI